MPKERYQQPERGFLHGVVWFLRTIMMLQYWRAMEQLLAYAKDKQAQHRPAWNAFNKAIGTDGSLVLGARPAARMSFFVDRQKATVHGLSKLRFPVPDATTRIEPPAIAKFLREWKNWFTGSGR